MNYFTKISIAILSSDQNIVHKYIIVINYLSIYRYIFVFSTILQFINNTIVVRTHMCACADVERYSKFWELLKLLDLVYETTTCIKCDNCN